MARFRATTPTFGKIKSESTRLAELWILRMLVPLRGAQKFVSEITYEHGGLADYLGLRGWSEDPSKLDTKAVHGELRALHAQGECTLRDASSPAFLRKNVERLRLLAGLSDVDCRILEFAALMRTDELLRETAALLGGLSSGNLFFALSVVLDIPEADVRKSLGGRGTLARTGLLSVARHAFTTMGDRLELLSPEFADTIVSLDADPMDLLKDIVVPSAPGELEAVDYRNIDASLSILRPYLKHVLTVGRKGVNIFLHGSPGTGKSQLARLLARELACELFEVASEDDSGDPVGGERRLRAFRAAQSFFSKRRALILFDEVEDVFNDNDGAPGLKGVAQSRKGWLNRMLEENVVPTLWLSNAIHTLDAAFVRRFDMVVEVPVPPKPQREHILLTACGDLLEPAALARLAELEDLAPAVVTRSAAVVRSVREEIGGSKTSDAIERLIGNTLEAQGHQNLCRAASTQLPALYDPTFVNADFDLSRVAAGLIRAKAGRLCLYGPPGTGKTAFARWLAVQIGAPLIVKRASDLLSRWVGGSERNIAGAFKAAEAEGAVLLVDEVDSFLQDRRDARATWEVSQVNELLTQMEAFPGVFIASTNMMGDLDQAALRRFDLKIKFDYLVARQAGDLLARHCEALTVALPDTSLLAKIGRLAKLTPGDFAAVARRSRFDPIHSPEELLAALVRECEFKEGARAPMGFIR